MRPLYAQQLTAVDSSEVDEVQQQLVVAQAAKAIAAASLSRARKDLQAAQQKAVKQEVLACCRYSDTHASASGPHACVCAWTLACVCRRTVQHARGEVAEHIVTGCQLLTTHACIKSGLPEISSDAIEHYPRCHADHSSRWVCSACACVQASMKAAGKKAFLRFCLGVLGGVVVTALAGQLSSTLPL